MIDVENRVPTPGQEGRVLITPEGGGAPYYATIQMADTPLADGTPWSRQTGRLLQADIRNYPIAAGQTIQAGDVVDVVNGEIVSSSFDVLDGAPKSIFSGGSITVLPGCAALPDGSSVSCAYLTPSSGTKSLVLVRLAQGEKGMATNIGTITSVTGFPSSGDIQFITTVPVYFGPSTYAVLYRSTSSSATRSTYLGIFSVSSGAFTSQTVKVTGGYPTPAGGASPHNTSGLAFYQSGDSQYALLSTGNTVYVYSVTNSGGTYSLSYLFESSAPSIENVTFSNLSVCGSSSGNLFAIYTRQEVNVYTYVGIYARTISPNIQSQTISFGAETALQAQGVLGDYSVSGLSNVSGDTYVIAVNGDRYLNQYYYDRNAVAFTVNGASATVTGTVGSDSRTAYATIGNVIQGGSISAFVEDTSAQTVAPYEFSSSWSQTPVEITTLADGYIGITATQFVYASDDVIYTQDLVTIYEMTQAIALRSGTSGQSIDIIYSGVTFADFAAEGQTIVSGGVCGAGILNGVLQVWSSSRPAASEVGIYTGTGSVPTETAPMVLNFPRPVKSITIRAFGYIGGDSPSPYGATFIRTGSGATEFWMDGFGSVINSCTVQFTGNSVKWWGGGADGSLNISGQTYAYEAHFV